MVRVAVVVIGEIGRSPRMQYHAVSLATQADCYVDLIGYPGSECWPEIKTNPKIKQYPLKTFTIPTGESLIAKILSSYLISIICKVFYQFFNLFWILMTIPRPDYILVQCPPSIPTLHVAHLICWLRWTHLIIDWHNYGYTIMQISKRAPALVSIYYYYEQLFGRGAKHYFCVSNLMKEDLLNRWRIRATVLYDRPPLAFKLAALSAQHNLFSKLTFGRPPNPLLNVRSSVTAFTKKENGKYVRRNDRPALIVSSTSWTTDEDFDVLLDAIQTVDEMISDHHCKFQIRLVVTGKGEMRSHYEKKIEDSIRLTNVRIHTTYLSYEDYITLLGSADVGICLHVSSSGVDLPMKVVDMFGCSLPVCAIDYPALPELVKHKETGLLFKTRKELSNHLWSLLKDFPKTPDLDRMRRNIEERQRTRWSEEWATKVLPLFK